MYGPETHITKIIPLTLGVTKNFSLKTPVNLTSTPGTPTAPQVPLKVEATEPAVGEIQPSGKRVHPNDRIVYFNTTGKTHRPWFRPFDETTRSFVFGLQPHAIQGMLDFDYSSGRSAPSVAAMIYPFGGHHIQNFYWGTKETLSVYASVKEAVSKHPDVDVVVNFARSQSVYSSTLDILEDPQIKAIALTAEGVPERHTREILHLAKTKDVLIIGPVTVGDIKPGCFRIGNSRGYVLFMFLTIKCPLAKHISFVV